MRTFTLQKAVEALRADPTGGVVIQEHQCLVLLMKHGLGFELRIEWCNQPPEEHFLLEENHLLTWWYQFTGEWLL